MGLQQLVVAACHRRPPPHNGDVLLLLGAGLCLAACTWLLDFCINNGTNFLSKTAANSSSSFFGTSASNFPTPNAFLAFVSWRLWAALAAIVLMAVSRKCRVFWHKQIDFIYRSYLTLNRDLTGLGLLIRIRLDMNRRMRENRGIHELFLDVVRAHPNKTCILDMASGQRYTFAEFNALANRFANHFRTQGYQCEDVVALFMENGAEFVAAWIGLAKIGVITAWINSDLRMESLAYCLRASNCKAVICSEPLWQTLQAAKAAGLLADVQHTIKEFVLSTADCEDDHQNNGIDANGIGGISAQQRLSAVFKREHAKLSVEPVPDRAVTFRSLLCFIYTSGTTGMPKPACIKHFRYYSMVTGCAFSFGLQPADRLYISMPLYHTAAGIIGIGQVLLRGSSAAIRKRFSASNFWTDCVAYECTLSQYIGEICRYLLLKPECPAERAHRVRLMFGNGLTNQEIWRMFVHRFGVKICEVYGSTEGTSNLVNIDGKSGACGFLPISPITKLVHPVRLVKVDENGEIRRQPNGLCISCRPGESGAMVSSIRPGNPLLVFDGYLNKAETSKKVIHNVFRPGDSAFLTGDILEWDRLGYLKFCIRTGDTFRFKGHNVSTAEVEAILLPLIELVTDVVVYAVEVPKLEGTVGMVALVRNWEKSAQVPEETFLCQLSAKLRDNLPSYALPRFMRMCSAVDRTGTFKLVKTHLRRRALAPAEHPDEQLFLLDARTQQFVPLDEELRQRLEQGHLEVPELTNIFA